MEKVLFVEIHSLDNEHGCYASNRYFAEFFNMSTRQIANYVSTLKEKGFITVTVKNQNERVIRTAGEDGRGPDEPKRRPPPDREGLIPRMTQDRAGGGGRKSY